MYGVVTRYVLKPKRALARSSSAPHLNNLANHQLINPSIQSTHSYGSGDELVAVPQSINQPIQQLHRSRTELPASRHIVYSYQTNQPSHQSPSQSNSQSSDESMPLMGFISPVKSDDKLPIILTLASSLGSLLFGFHIGYSSPFEQSVYQAVNPSFSNTTALFATESFIDQPINQSIEQVSKSQLDLMFSLISIGAIIGALTSGPIAAKYGRRFAILQSSIPYLLGTLIMIFSTKFAVNESINQSINQSLLLLSLGRLLIGVGVGASSVLVPLYIAEISPPSLRGSLGATNSFCMSLGLVFVNSLGLGGVKYASFWQIALFLSLVPLIVMAVVMWLFGVETPRFLMSVDREDEAKSALRKLRGDGWDVDGELRDLAGWDEFGLGSVTQSKAMLARWKAEYLELFEDDEDDQSTNQSINENDVYGDLHKSESTDNFEMNRVKHDLQMPSPPPTIDTGYSNQSNNPNPVPVNQVVTPRSADSTQSVGVLKSALSSKRISRSSSANLSDQVTNQLVVLPEQKKTVRVKLPGRDEAEATSSPSPPWKSTSKHSNNHLVEPVKPSLARARSIARRAFPIHAVTTSATPWWSSDHDDDNQQSSNQSIYWQRANLIPLLIGVSLQFIQQASGINAFMFHMKDLLEGGASAESADSQETALYGAIAVNGLQLLMGGVALVLMDRAGRRTWLLASCVGLTFGAMMLSYCYATGAPNAWKIAGMMVYIAAFGMGMGPMPWLICSEIFPSAIRSTAVSLATTVNWASAFVITATFPVIDHLIGTAGVYALYGTIIAASAVYIAFALPETRGKSLDEIEAMFAKDAHSHAHDSHV